MKKILRLVTTSVLTLTLVACGEASSSVSSSVSSTPASSVSSAVSNFANVSTITLSAATDVLTQTMGTQKAVVVQAELNANTNPSLALEWFVNGTKSNQTGRVFEFTPATAGSFEITARVGSVTSNKINVAVGNPVFTADAEVKDASTLEIKAVGGATVTVTNNEVLDTSFYDLKRGVYVVNLKTALSQGASTTVTLAREGSESVAKVVTFDTRKLEVGTSTFGGVAADIKLVAGVYEVVRPHILNASGNLNTVTPEVALTFKSTNLNTTAALLTYKVERTSAPDGAVAFAVQQGQVAVAANDAGGAATNIRFNVSRTTPLGNYVFKVTLGEKVIDVTVKVINADAKLALDPFTSTNNVVVQTGVIGGALSATQTPVALTGTVYEITKDYLLTDYKQFSFKFDATNISVPEALLGTLTTPNPTTPNQIQATLSAPGGLGFMRTTSTLQQQALPTPVSFRNLLSDFTVVQKLDSTTPVGDYVYTVRILQLGQEIHTSSVTVRVKDPVASMTLSATVTDPSALQWLDVASGAIHVHQVGGAFGHIGVVSATQPATQANLDKWLDTSTTPAVLKQSNGTAFSAVSLSADTTLFDEINGLKYDYTHTGTSWANVTATYIASLTLTGTELKPTHFLEHTTKEIFAIGTSSFTKITDELVFLDSYSTLIYNYAAGDWTVSSTKWSGAIGRTSISATVASTEPSTPATNSYWLDTSAAAHVLKQYNGTAFVAVSTPANKALIFNAAAANVYEYDSTSAQKWVDGFSFKFALLSVSATTFVLREDTGTWVAVASGGTIGSPVTLADALTAGTFNASLTTQLTINALTLANPNAVGTFYGNTSTNKLIVTKLRPAITDLTATADVITISKPTISTLDTLTVNVSAVVKNYQSPLNLSAGIRDSFDGVGGPREFVDFVKTYTGPMTLATSNLANRKVAVVIGTGTSTVVSLRNPATGTYVSGGQGDRSATLREYYDLYTTAGDTLTLSSVFELPLNSVTSNGTYTFTLKVGELTKTVSVVVQNPTPSIQLFVMNENKVVPAVGNKYTVALDAPTSGKARVNFDVNLLNLRPASFTAGTTTLTYSLERNFNALWTDVRTNTALPTNKLGNDGHLVSTELNQLLQGNVPEQTNASQLDYVKTGTYTYKLTIGSAVREFVVEVLAFPSVSIENAFLGVESLADTTPVVLFESSYLIKKQANATTKTHLYMDLKAVNLPATVYYVVSGSAGSIASPIALTGTALDDAKLTFNATTSLARIKFVPADVAGAVGFATADATDGVVGYINLYNAAKDFIGYKEFRYRVIDTTTPAAWALIP